jgi:hypothetical protein
MKAKMIITTGSALAVLTLLVLASAQAGSKPLSPKTGGKVETAPMETPIETSGTGQKAEEIPDTSAAEKAATEDIYNWQVVSAAGIVNGNSADYILHGSAGQVATGMGYTNTYKVSHGFWQDFSGPGICCDTPGDANADLEANVGDAVFLINHIFRSGPGPDCALEGDANGDCSINVGDAVFLISFCFNYGEIPFCGCP